MTIFKRAISSILLLLRIQNLIDYNFDFFQLGLTKFKRVKHFQPV